MDFSELFAHISKFDTDIKAELMNSLKYGLVCLPVVVAGIEGIKALKPRTQEDPEHQKSTAESAMTVITMLVGIIVVLFAADRFATYFVPDGDYRVIGHAVLFMVIADNSVGSSIRNLMREWGMREGMENLDEPAEQRPEQKAAIQAVQQHPQMQPRPPPVHQMPMNSNNLQTGGHQPAPPVQQELNNMMSHDIEPMAFSEVGGGSFGGSAF
jgi:hypothetical protein